MYKKNLTTEVVRSIVFAFFLSQVDQGIVLPSASILWTLADSKNPPTFRLRLFVFALLIFPVGQGIVTAWEQSGGLFQPLFAI